MNLRPPACKADALPTELPAHIHDLPITGHYRSVKGIIPACLTSESTTIREQSLAITGDLFVESVDAMFCADLRLAMEIGLLTRSLPPFEEILSYSRKHLF